MKRCRQCGQIKDHYATIGTHCKDCWKEHVRAYRLANLPNIKAYDRARGQDPKRKAAVKAWRERQKDIDPEGWREKRRLAIAADRKRIAGQNAARMAVERAIKRGDLIPGPCERCGSRGRVHAHHENYDRQLDVNWLCPPCHGERHREINDLRRSF